MEQVLIPEDIIQEIITILASEGDTKSIWKFYTLSSFCCTQVRKYVFSKIDTKSKKGTSCNMHTVYQIATFFSEHSDVASYVRSLSFHHWVRVTAAEEQLIYDLVLHNLPNLTYLTVSFTEELKLPPSLPVSFRAALQQLPPSASLQHLHLKDSLGITVAEIAGIRSLKCLILDHYKLIEQDDSLPQHLSPHIANPPCQLTTLRLYKPVAKYPFEHNPPTLAREQLLLESSGGINPTFILPLSQLRVLGMQIDTQEMFHEMLELIQRQHIMELEELTIELGKISQFPLSVSNGWLDDIAHLIQPTLKKLILRPIICDGSSIRSLFGTFRETITSSAGLLSQYNVLEEFELHIVVQYQGVKHLKGVRQTMGTKLLRLFQAFGLVVKNQEAVDGWSRLKKSRLMLGLRGQSDFSAARYLQDLKLSSLPHLEPLFKELDNFSFDVVPSCYDEVQYAK